MSRPLLCPLYIPGLHPETLPAWLPDGISVFSVGLDGITAAVPPQTPLFLSPCLPYSRQEAKACLVDLQRMDADVVNAVVQPQAAESLRQSMSPHEVAALADFVRPTSKSGTLHTPSPLPTNSQSSLPSGNRGSATLAVRAEARRRAQRLLLLAWLQEKHVHEINALTTRYDTGMALLARQLGEVEQDAQPDNDDEVLSNPAYAPLQPDVRDLLAPWGFVTELVTILLPHWDSNPADAHPYCLCAADPLIRADLEERGLDLLPLSLDEQALLPKPWFTPDAAWRFLGKRLPLWRLLGRSIPEPGRPWLHASMLFLFVERS